MDSSLCFLRLGFSSIESPHLQGRSIWNHRWLKAMGVAEHLFCFVSMVSLISYFFRRKNIQPKERERERMRENESSTPPNRIQPKEREKQVCNRERKRENEPSSISPEGHFPCELIENILLRLSVKNLLRYRCVSKSWHTLIDDIYFVKKHLKYNVKSNTDLGLIVKEDFYDNWMRTAHLDDMVGHDQCNFVRVDIDNMDNIVGSCNGLICLSSYNLTIWNPYTGKAYELPHDPTKISFLLTIPPSVGYEQNPVSLYYFYEAEGSPENLKKCIAEATNTPWGERVSFLFNPNTDLITKTLHVSPFMDMLGNRRIKTKAPKDNLFVSISVQHPKLGDYFTATLTAKRILSLESDHALFFWLMPHKVAVWIYWNALKLWWKGVPFIQHPRYSNLAYRQEALIRDTQLQCCQAFAQDTQIHLPLEGRDSDSVNDENGWTRCFTWRDAKWPWS